MTEEVPAGEQVEGEEEEIQQSASQVRLLKYKSYVVKPEQIDELWDAENPVDKAQEFLLEYIDDYNETNGTDIQKYDQYEKRYEPNGELKILADYLINGLVFLKHDCKMTDNDAIAETLDCLWQTLDFLNYSLEIEMSDGSAGAVHSRFEKLQQGLTELYSEKKIDRKQTKNILEYSKNTLFGHMQLFLQCLKMKQARREKPIKIMAQIPQLATAGGLVSDECKEIGDDQEGGDAAIDAIQLEGTIHHESIADGAEEAVKVEEQEEVIDPDDPLYGLEQRLKNSNIDADTKEVIKTKLAEAQGKIKEQLDARQANLDAKVAAGGKKK